MAVRPHHKGSVQDAKQAGHHGMPLANSDKKVPKAKGMPKKGARTSFRSGTR